MKPAITQINLLLEHYNKTKDLKSKERIQVLILYLKKYPHSKIQDVTFKKESTIDRWIREYKLKGIGSIFTGYYSNQNASKLTNAQKLEIKKHLEGQPLPDKFWSLDNIKEYISARFDIEYRSKQSYYAILTFCNYSYKLPSIFNIRRDDDFVEERVKEIREEIKDYLTDPNSIVFTADESRLEWKTLKRKGWFKKGEKTVIKEIKEQKQYQSFIGLLDLKTKEDLLYRLEWQNQEKIIEVLKDIKTKYPNKKIHIIWDNAGFHRGNQIKELLGKGNILENIKLIWLPPYAPDKNPQEFIWNYAKRKISNKVFKTFNDMVLEFEKNIIGQKFDYNF